MRLHENAEAFKQLLLDMFEKNGMRRDILEKDYYVTLMLRELADKQKKLPAYFKGGTALYKALRCIRRFSEDIDLTVSTDGCVSNNSKKKRVEDAAKNYTSLPEIEDEENKTGSTAVIRIYGYESMYPIVEDLLQRFGRVKIEATSFTKSEPHIMMEVAPMIYDLADDDAKMKLRDEFDVRPFKIATIKLERIFIDKIFAAEFYYTIPEVRDYMDSAKHLYDLAVLSALPEIEALFNDIGMCRYLVNLKREEEGVRYNSQLKEKPFRDFTLFDSFRTNAEYLRSYAEMQKVYVSDREDIISVDRLQEAAERIFGMIREWDF